MDEHIGYEKSERSDEFELERNYRNGYKNKRVNSSYGNMSIDVPQDRNSSFEPNVVKKRRKDISDIERVPFRLHSRKQSTGAVSYIWSGTH